jgi:hypothetical protein
MNHLKHCAVCGQRFEAKRADAKTCSKRCRSALARQKEVDTGQIEAATEADIRADILAALKIIERCVEATNKDEEYVIRGLMKDHGWKRMSPGERREHRERMRDLNWQSSPLLIARANSGEAEK